jgi:hypothetical protein
MNKPSARSAMPSDKMYSQTEYHHCGTPIPVRFQTVHQANAQKHADEPKQRATMAAQNRASVLRRAMELVSEKC